MGAENPKNSLTLPLDVFYFIIYIYFQVIYITSFKQGVDIP